MVVKGFSIHCGRVIDLSLLGRCLLPRNHTIGSMATEIMILYSACLRPRFGAHMLGPVVQPSRVWHMLRLWPVVQPSGVWHMLRLWPVVQPSGVWHRLRLWPFIAHAFAPVLEPTCWDPLFNLAGFDICLRLWPHTIFCKPRYTLELELAEPVAGALSFLMSFFKDASSCTEKTHILRVYWSMGSFSTCLKQHMY